jgi:hypothetical protein
MRDHRRKEHMIKKTIKLALYASLASSLCTTLSCSSRGFDRSTASERIQRAVPFTHPYAMIVRHQRDRRYIDPASPDETREQGEARAVESWRTSSPYRAVLVALGLVDVRAKYASVEEGRSAYDLDIRPTPKSDDLWRQMGVAVDDTAVPLARRKLVSVTGITTPSPTHATAEFTWQWETTAAGAAMALGTPEFNSLPDQIRQMFETTPSYPPSLKARTPLSLTGTFRGIANFERYDDGWRLDEINPSGTAPLNVLD